MHRIICSAAVVVLLASCTAVPIRTNRCDASKEANRCEQYARTVETSIKQINESPLHREEVKAATFENHRADGFQVGFIEFDDQGWFHNHEQFETVKAQVEKALSIDRPKQTPAILVAFTHGWRHTAAACDRDVVCFREVLRGLAVYEEERAKLCGDPAKPECARRMVVGVMTGWRGAPISKRAGLLENLNVLSFYSRKRTAHLIGQSGYVSTVVGWLNQLHRRLPENSRLVLAGHSFGGAMLFSSVAGVLNQQVAEARYRPGRPDLLNCDSFDPAGIGDLVVLLNPAFEALRYDSIHDRTRDLVDCKPRRTLMLTLASETDRYNSIAFTAGRALGTLFQRFPSAKQRSQSLHAVGHHTDFQTHRLDANTALSQTRALFTDVDGTTVKEPCRCQYKVNEEAMRQLARDVATAGARGAGSALAAYGFSDGGVCTAPSCLKPVPGKQMHNPFKVVQVDSEIINGHSDIYNPRILDFLVRSVSSAADPRVAPPRPVPSAATQPAPMP
ncbi:MAG: hypothetical protein M3Q69_13505 [Acidobacteriota bacterium]|nr:hypothetical protein [Acidobacteriota bacterium]